MQDDFPGGDPKTIWLNQPTEVSTMTFKKDSTDRELNAKTRRK